MDHKTFTSYLLKSDADQGIVESIVAVMGNVDEVDDVIHPGSFAKTISERMGKTRVLDQHNTDSILRVLGRPLEMREIGRSELPADLLMKYPEAVGGLYTKTQYNLKTDNGRNAFNLIAAGDVGEYSIGYDALDSDFSKVKSNGKERTVRNLRTIKLYEYSPVIWGANSATTTLSTKDAPSEGKPWATFHEGDKWNVYKLDADGNQVGKPLGEHDTEAEARAQVSALYANEGKGSEENAVHDDAVPAPETKAGRVIAGRNMERLMRIMEDLQAVISDATASDKPTDDEAPAEDMQAAKSADEAAQAGPSIETPTIEALKMLEAELNLTYFTEV